MNKTVNINLGGLFFHIDEDAYQRLSVYLEAIRKQFNDQDAQTEIMTDIESRISELLSENLKSDRQVIILRDIEQVINIMGEPKDYRIEDGENPQDSKKEYRSTTEAKGLHRKVYRDSDNGILGGVLAGFEHFFGIDKVWLRIIAIVLFFVFGSGILIYLILWAIIPNANTTAEKLEMRGEAVNISNIERKVREEFENLSNKLNNIDYDRYKNQFQTTTRDIGSGFSVFLSKLVTIIGKIIGAFVIIAVVLIIGSLTVAGVYGFSETNFIGIYHDYPIWLLVPILVLIIGIPLSVLLILGFRLLISNSKPIKKPIKYTLIIIWILALIALIGIWLKQNYDTSHDIKISERYDFNIQKGDTLDINLKTDARFENMGYNSYKTALDVQGKEMLYFNKINLSVRKSTDEHSYIMLQKSAEGGSLQKAKQTAEAIGYGFEFKEKELNLDDFLYTLPENKFRNQRLDVMIYLPENTCFKVNKNTLTNQNRLYIETAEERTLAEFGSVYKLTQVAYECLSCQPKETHIPTVSELPDKNRLTIDETGVVKNNIK